MIMQTLGVLASQHCDVHMCRYRSSRPVAGQATALYMSKHKLSFGHPLACVGLWPVSKSDEDVGESIVEMPSIACLGLIPDVDINIR